MSDDTPIERGQTGVRIALTLVFALAAGVVEFALRALIIFSLLYVLVTRRPPSSAVRNASNTLSAYLYRIYRYLTYNEPRAPFPFDDLPGALEAGHWSDDTTEAELRDQISRRPRRREPPDDPDLSHVD
jgi:hypothetical protein